MAVRILFLFPLSLLLFNCENPIKNTKEKVVVEKGTEVDLASDHNLPLEKQSATKIDSIPFIDSSADNESMEKVNPQVEEDCIGYWVGYFKKDTEKNFEPKKDKVFNEYIWQRENKINISIDKIIKNKVIGHSVVAGNNRPFEGTIFIDSSDFTHFVYHFELKEPGDDKYDGEFKFKIESNRLTGKWVAYKNIDIKKRKYTLEMETLKYDTSQLLEYSKRYLNWKKTKIKKARDEGDEEYNAVHYSTSTNKIYKVNASSKLLSKEDVENLTKGDLKIIRNTIYARHGYSFKNRQLRVFFDAQPWYIPVHTDIKKELTEIEKKNIRLLLKYEKNAVEYYDLFGRG